MRSGVAEKRRAVAAGMISRAETRRIPTAFIAKATATAISSMKTRPVSSALMPSARASSSFTVRLRSERH